MPGWRKSLMLQVRDFLIRVFFYVIEYYSVMFYDTKKLSGQAPYLYLFFFEIKI